jgi:transketolase
MVGLMLVQMSSMRDALADALLELGAKDPRVVVLGADTTVSIKTSLFADRYPDRFYNIGIAEANMIGIAAGLALAGKIPYVSTYSAFVPGKCLDQIRNAVAYPNLDVKIVSSHGGVSVGPDGASHQTVEDVAAMRAIPHMRVVVPADAPATKALIEESWKIPGPFYIRLSRPSVPEVYSASPDLKIGHARILKGGTDVAIVACGVMVNQALEAGESLAKEGISAEIVDSHTLKPFDADTIISAAKKTGGIVTAEEQNIIGGLGSAVAEVVSGSYPVPVSMVGVRDTFGESGEYKELMAKYGLTSKDIVRAAKKLVAAR